MSPSVLARHGRSGPVQLTLGTGTSNRHHLNHPNPWPQVYNCSKLTLVMVGPQVRCGPLSSPPG